MGFLSHLFWPWGILLQVLAIVHFIRRRPDQFWIWVILFLGPIGAVVYIFAEVIPDIGSLRGSFKFFPRRKRIAQLRAIVQQNPSAGNWEELGDLLMEDGKTAAARGAFDRAIAARGDSLDAFYRRGVCAVKLAAAAAAAPELERVVAKEPGYDFFRAQGLLAHAYALAGQRDRAEALFTQAVSRSVLSETYLSYATLLESEGRRDEAKHWAQQVLAKKPGMPGYQKRRERPSFRKAAAMLKRLN
jgi:hypothetical protein